MPFISYLRVSTSRQGESGLGLEAQRAAVEQYLRGHAAIPLAEYVEVESGKSGSRPVLDRALAHCRRERATLVIAKLDRLARNVAFVSSLMEARTEFVACDAPYANRLMIHILAAFAEHEREQIAARTRAALAAAKARGVKLGSHGAVLAHQRREEAQVRAEALRDSVTQLAGQQMTLAQIASALNEAREATRDGAPWSPTTVQRVLRRLDLRQPATAAPSPLQPQPSHSPTSPHPNHQAES